MLLSETEGKMVCRDKSQVAESVSRGRRPHARGKVPCAEPGRSHTRPGWQSGSGRKEATHTSAMHVGEKSDKVILPKKQPNRMANDSTEAVEGRTLTKGNSSQTAAAWTQSQSPASNGLEAVRKAARKGKGTKFTALMHHITPELLRKSYFALKRNAMPGIDGVTWSEYGTNLKGRLDKLHDQLHKGAYRAKPAKRIYRPKPDGSKRPIGIQSIEDKVVQQAVVSVLEAIYEVDFMGFSYGFRPKRGQHDALDALQVGLYRKKVNWVLDADIKGFFDAMDHDWMLAFLRHRIRDKRIYRLIRKWLRVGYIDDGRYTRSRKGTPQGAVISPILSNIFLHYVFDLWAHHWRVHQATGDVIILRYADDLALGFQHEYEAIKFQKALEQRLARFCLALHPKKTRLIRFGRYASQQCKEKGLGKPETFDFLGFTHYCTRSHKTGWYVVGRKSAKSKLRAQLAAIKASLRKRLHRPVPETGKWLTSVLRGHLNYYAVPGNSRSLNFFFDRVKYYWLRALRRRSQRHKMNWERYAMLVKRYIPAVRILHPQPIHRFVARTQGRSPVR